MKRVVFLSVLVAAMSGPSICIAGPADYVYTPNIERGELELDVKYGTATAGNGVRPQAASIGLGYGVSEQWFTEGYIKQKHGSGGDSTYIEWENRFLLSGPDESDMKLGLVTELEMPVTRGVPRELRVGPLLQIRHDQLQWNGNLIFERAFGGADEDGVAQVTNLAYQWQAKYHWMQAMGLGIQGFGELGKWDRWSRRSEQNHRMGPAVYGRFALTEHQVIKYNTAWLFGLTGAAPRATLRFQAEYEF